MINQETKNNNFDKKIQDDKPKGTVASKAR